MPHIFVSPVQVLFDQRPESTCLRSECGAKVKVEIQVTLRFEVFYAELRVGHGSSVIHHPRCLAFAGHLGTVVHLMWTRIIDQSSYKICRDRLVMKEVHWIKLGLSTNSIVMDVMKYTMFDRDLWPKELENVDSLPYKVSALIDRMFPISEERGRQKEHEGPFQLRKWPPCPAALFWTNYVSCLWKLIIFLKLKSELYEIKVRLLSLLSPRMIRLMQRKLFVCVRARICLLRLLSPGGVEFLLSKSADEM